MSSRVFSDKVKDLFDKDEELTGRPLLRMAIGRIFDDVDSGTPIVEAMYKHYRLLQVPLYKIEDAVYEVTGQRIKAAAAGYPKFKRRFRKHTIDKTTGEVSVVPSTLVLTNMLIGQNPSEKVTEPTIEVEVKPIDIEAQIILTSNEFNSLQNIYKSHYSVVYNYIIISVEPKTIGLKFLDNKFNIKMEISSERIQPTPEVKRIEAIKNS